MLSKIEESNINLWLINCERGEQSMVAQNTSPARVKVARLETAMLVFILFSR